MASDRKLSYKLPPTNITQLSVSQKSRREKALEDQKRRRAHKFDLSRQLDGLADLNIADSDSDEPNPDGVKIVHTGLASFTSALSARSPVDTGTPPTPTSEPSKPTKKRKKQKRTTRVGKSGQTSDWADKCMYAELLEMNEDDPWSSGDGLPDDLHTAWIAVAPVPVGKRCLAITRESQAASNGVDPNTTLRSRLLGKPIMPWFPSCLPPSTVLDCILDEKWRENGVLHVLDILKWKGQDIADCETPFRFWWRDTRLGELTQLPPPSHGPTDTSSTSPITYRFAYPNTLLPIPYHTDLSISSLLTTIIPLSRAPHSAPITIPTLTHIHTPGARASAGTMDLDPPSFVPFPSSNTQSTYSSIPMPISPDGILLYVSEASYESGTSPLSTWVPLKPLIPEPSLPSPSAPASESPMDKFERLLRRRQAQGNTDVKLEESMDIGM